MYYTSNHVQEDFYLLDIVPTWITNKVVVWVQWVESLEKVCSDSKARQVIRDLA